MHIDWFVFFCQIFNFLLLMYLLKRFLYGRILKAMDDRETKISARFAEADELKAKANEAAELYESAISSSRNQRKNAQRSDDGRRRQTQGTDGQRPSGSRAGENKVAGYAAAREGSFFHDLRQRAAMQLYATARKALSDLADADLEERIMMNSSAGSKASMRKKRSNA